MRIPARIAASTFAVAAIMATPALTQDTASTQAVIERHLAAFGAGDMDAFMADYTDESIVIFPGMKMTGSAAFQPFAQSMFDEFGQEGVVFEMLEMQFEGEVAYIQWKAETPNAVYGYGSDTFVVEDGKIIYQTAAFTMTPK